MICPFGKEVGDPPTITRCPSGFPGCSCGDEITMYTLGYPDQRADAVVRWWEQYGYEF